MKSPRIRLARYDDLAALAQLEVAAFAADRFHEDQIDYLLTRAHSTILVAEDNNGIAGAAYLLWRRAMISGRLYNLVIHPSCQGQGLGARLLEECEREAARRGCESMLLEVRCDNTGAIAFYERHGYEIRATLTDYYDDHSSGYKMAKDLLISVPEQISQDIPYYAQTLAFTCGPACLMMALKRFQPDFELNPTEEINLWREATLVFMTAGIGGTGPHGLALSAQRRGLPTRLWMSSERTPFRRSVRDKKKREVIALAHRDLRQRAEDAGVEIAVFDFTLADIISMIHRKLVPILLVSSYHLNGHREPHWVVVTGFDRDCFYVQDPDLDAYDGNWRQARRVGITRALFPRVSRYGKDQFRSCILIGPPV
jgi:ribosomal-protein-alanine acetyltransferase